jgi:VIT1/CCC1 family predicted Fe2+/Mn2+ transporter
MPFHSEGHLSHRGGWLRAAVLGANDGILSTAGLVLGVAAANSSTSAIATAGLAGLVARRELEQDPDGELRELTQIYEARGLSPELARQVAVELSAGDRLAVHARDELGIEEDSMARPAQAAWSSAVSFALGAAIPVLAITLTPGGVRVPLTVTVTLIALAALGAVGARLGGAPLLRASMRVAAWGAVAMALTSAIGALVGTAV